MAEADLTLFREKIRQLNAFLALSDSDPEVGEALRQCSHHEEVVALARSHGFEIGRRWGEPPQASDVQQNDGTPSLWGGTPPPQGQESVEVLLVTADLRLERIHSNAASSAPGFWYDQQDHEWVCLLHGSAQVHFADEESPRLLHAGDSLLIKAHHRHRVVATDPCPGTVWLALYWREIPGH